MAAGEEMTHHTILLLSRGETKTLQRKKKNRKKKKGIILPSVLPPLASLPPPGRLQVTASTSSLQWTVGHRDLSSIWFALASGLYFGAPQVSPCFLIRNHGHEATRCWVWLGSRAQVQEHPTLLLPPQAAREMLWAGGDRDRQCPPALPKVTPSTHQLRCPHTGGLLKPCLSKGSDSSSVLAALCGKMKTQKLSGLVFPRLSSKLGCFPTLPLSPLLLPHQIPPSRQLWDFASIHHWDNPVPKGFSPP